MIDISLSYTAAPGISEHYNACRKMTAFDPMPSDQNIEHYNACRKMTAFDPMSSDPNIGETQVQSGMSLDSNVICTDKVTTILHL